MDNGALVDWLFYGIGFLVLVRTGISLLVTGKLSDSSFVKKGYKAYPKGSFKRNYVDLLINERKWMAPFFSGSESLSKDSPRRRYIQWWDNFSSTLEGKFINFAIWIGFAYLLLPKFGGFIQQTLGL